MASGNSARSSTGLFTLLPNEAVELDVLAFDNLVRSKGVKLIHYRAIPCPIGLTDALDIRRTHADHSGCSNGFIYKPIGRVTSLFTSNATDPRKLDSGFYDGSTVVVTFPRFYDSDPEKRVMVRPFDRFFLEEEDLLVGIWDKTHRRNDLEPDRVEFFVSKVEHLIDANGTWWSQGVSFEVVNGCIVWKENLGPAPGTVYSVWYLYRPYWYVDRLIHEIRVTPVPDVINTNLVGIERLAYGAVLHREYLYKNQVNDESAPDNKGRKQKASDTPEPAEEF